jgi:hypothetical protein
VHTWYVGVLGIFDGRHALDGGVPGEVVPVSELADQVVDGLAPYLGMKSGLSVVKFALALFGRRRDSGTLRMVELRSTQTADKDVNI